MDYSVLDNFVSAYNNKEQKHELNKDEQKKYETEIISLIKAEGFTEIAEAYILKMPFQGGLMGYIDWFRTVPEDNQYESIIRLMNNQQFIEMTPTRKLRVIFYLLAKLISERKENKDAIEGLLLCMESNSYKKDGKRINDFSKIFKNNFMAELGPLYKLPELRSLNLEADLVERIITALKEAIDGIDAKGDKELNGRDRLKNWINKYRAVEQAKQEKTEEKNKSTPNVVTKSESTGYKSMEQADPKGSQSSKTNNSTEMHGKDNSAAVTKMYELISYLKHLEARVSLLEEENSKKERELNNLKKKLANLNLEREKLQNKYDDLNTEVSKRNKKIDELENENTEIKERMSRQEEVIKVYGEDKANSQSEQLNAIASSLSRCYQDFMMAQDMEISTELEITLIDLLEDIFKKLEKVGIDVKGRKA